MSQFFPLSRKFYYCFLGLGLYILGFAVSAVRSRTSQAVAEDITEVPNVAFVFAGSARSFVRPAVHLSLKYNLIEGFCPPETCHSQVFIRMSIADNTHTQENEPILNAVGKLIPKSTEKEEWAQRAVQALGEHVHLKVSEIGSEDEQIEMKQLVGNSTMLKIYRDLDSRRFNMYFNRWAAYRMATDFETVFGQEFTWIVHARLDFMWAEPVKPVRLWNPLRLWVPDQWGTDIPDTFSLIPRQFSDVYYSLPAMYENQKVACLGGPNFDPNSISDDSLAYLHYSDEQRALVHSELCLKKFSQIPTHTNKHKVVWSWAGLSEIMLKRKLVENGINLPKRTLGFSTFLGFIVRYPFEIRCHEQEPNSFIAWAKDYYQPSLATIFTCCSMTTEFERTYNRNPTRSSSRERHCHKPVAVGNGTRIPLCLLDSAVTKWNFLPYRLIGPQGYCLTMPAMSTDMVVKGEACFETTEVSTSSKRETYMMKYRTAQLFRVYPATTIPQQIWNVDYNSARKSWCFTVVSRNGMRIVEKGLCKDATDENYNGQLFQVQEVSASSMIQLMWTGDNYSLCVCQVLTRLELAPCLSNSVLEPRSIFRAVRTENDSPSNY
jgi:hypothetical protein